MSTCRSAVPAVVDVAAAAAAAAAAVVFTISAISAFFTVLTFLLFYCGPVISLFNSIIMVFFDLSPSDQVNSEISSPCILSPLFSLLPTPYHLSSQSVKLVAPVS